MTGKNILLNILGKDKQNLMCTLFSSAKAWERAVHLIQVCWKRDPSKKKLQDC